MSIGMKITEELSQKIAEAALRIQKEKVDAVPLNDTGLTLVLKGSEAHRERESTSQYLGDFKNGGEYLLFAS